MPQKVREDILTVYKLIAEAESYAHGVPVTEIHFHEVGTLDAVADITAVCLLMEKSHPAGDRFSDPCGQRPCQMRAWHSACACACDSLYTARYSCLWRGCQG